MSQLSLLQTIEASAIGVVAYDKLTCEQEHLDYWLAAGYNDNLNYMATYRRENPEIILDDCKSLIVCLFSPQKWSYHTPIRKRLKRLLTYLKELDSTIEGRGVVDTAPILERAWAARAGLGWIGRNSMLIHPELGSNFNIGILLVNKSICELSKLTVNLEQQLTEGSFKAIEDGCRECRELCRVNCPGGAINDNRTIDCRKCLSHISQKENREVKGCTVCQKVCPYNISRYIDPNSPIA